MERWVMHRECEWVEAPGGGEEGAVGSGVDLQAEQAAPAERVDPAGDAGGADRKQETRNGKGTIWYPPRAKVDR
eukprot:scaffold7713_cov100-Isochrysis_galbana.AAC.2